MCKGPQLRTNDTNNGNAYVSFYSYPDLKNALKCDKKHIRHRYVEVSKSNSQEMMRHRESDPGNQGNF